MDKMEKIVYPDYNNSILNLITSILKYYKVDTKHSSLKILDNKLNNKYKNVVLIILDGMGEHILKNISKDGFLYKNKIDTITSVYPSTTTAALTTYYSGMPPYESGWIAWSQYFKEYGRCVDMLSHKESYKGDDVQNTRIDVFDKTVKYTPIFEQIENASPNVKAYEITPDYSDKRSKRSLRANSIDELCQNIEMLCKVPEEKFILAYSDKPDNLLHKYGCTSEEVKEYIKYMEDTIKNMCSKLSDDSIVIISADHGHKDINKVYNILDYTKLQECLIMPASLESRSVAFWVKEERKEEFEKIFKEIFKDDFLLLNKKEIIEKKLLGYGQMHSKIDDFIGNYMALSVSDAIIKLETYLWDGKNVKKSTHCGLTQDEMEVPLIVID